MKCETNDHDAKVSGTQGYRKPYTRPSVSVVPLKLEEAVLSGCKTSASAGSGFTACDTTGPCLDLSAS